MMRHLGLALLLVTLPFASGCALVAMQVPKGLAGHALTVTEDGGVFKERHLRYGPWETADVDRDFTKRQTSWTQTFAWKGARSQASQGYRLKLNKGGAALFQIECEARHRYNRTEVFVFGKVRSLHEVACQLVGVDKKAAPAILHVHFYRIMGFDAPVAVPAGEFKAGGATYSAELTYRNQKGTGTAEPLGLVFVETGKQVAAIQLVNAAKIWLAPGLSPSKRDDLAGALAALALYRPLKLRESTEQ